MGRLSPRFTELPVAHIAEPLPPTTDSLTTDSNMRILIYILFAVTLVATTVVLLTPAESVRHSSASVKRQPTVKAQRNTIIYKAINDGDNWHVFWFFVLAGMGMLLPATPSLRSGIIILLLLNAYSLSSEVIQETLIPGRSFEWPDLGMNALGIVVGATSSLAIRKGKV